MDCGNGAQAFRSLNDRTETGGSTYVLQSLSRRIERSPVATVVRAGATAAARLAVHAVLALHHVALAIPEVIDAPEVGAEGAGWVIDILSAAEGIA